MRSHDEAYTKNNHRGYSKDDRFGRFGRFGLFGCFTHMHIVARNHYGLLCSSSAINKEKGSCGYGEKSHGNQDYRYNLFVHMFIIIKTRIQMNKNTLIRETKRKVHVVGRTARKQYN